MALSIKLSNASSTADLIDGTNYKVQVNGFDLGFPVRDLVFEQARRNSFDALANITYRNRKIAGQLTVLGNSLDNWTANLAKIDNIITESARYYESEGLVGAPAYLDYQLNGMTTFIRYDVLAGTVNPGNNITSPLMMSTVAPRTQDVGLELIVKPFGRDSALTNASSSAVLNNGVVFTLTSPAGDYDPPAHVTLESTSGVNLYRGILWRRSIGNTANFVHLLEAHNATYPNYESSASTGLGITLTNATGDVTAIDGTRLNIVAENTSGLVPTIEWKITGNLVDQIGKFRVFLRAKFQNGSSTGYKLQLRYGAGSLGDRIIVNTAVLADNSVLSSAEWRLLDMGLYQYPPMPVPLDAALPPSGLTLYAQKNATGAIAWDIDAAFLVPVDEDIMDWQTTMASPRRIHSDAIAVRPSLYDADTTADQPFFSAVTTVPTHTFFRPRRGVSNIFGALLCSNLSNAHVFNETWKAKVSYYSLYVHTK